MSASPNGLMKPRSLGSKARSFVPMTPRSLKSNDDSHSEPSRQAAAHNPRAHDGQPPHKKFKSSAAPKGTKLASGYVDRVQERHRGQDGDGDGDEKHTRLKRLEEMLKLQQIDQETFDRLKIELGIGGDTSSTHLVKGLDFKLLERVRRGEEVDKQPAPAEKNVEPAEEADVDDELEKALERTEVEARQARQDDDAADDANAQVPESEATILSRDEILRRLRQNRKNANLASPDPSPAQPTSTLDHSRFRKLESASKPNKKRFTETVNGRRREVLLVTDKEGKTKRKTRWLDPEPDSATGADAQKKGESAQAWGDDLPEQLLARQKAAAAEAARNAAGEDEGDDIFGGVAEYDPLAGLDSDGEREAEKSEADGEQPAEATTKPVKARDYFAGTSDANDSRHPAHDPSILAALKRAAQIRRQEDDDGESHDRSKDQPEPPSEHGERNAALLRKLQSQSHQDDMDLDMAFGGGGGDDDDDDDNGLSKQKLSQWVGLGQKHDDDEEEIQRGSGRKRKSGGKKKKGNKEDFRAVMNVLEGRKKS